MSGKENSKPWHNRTFLMFQEGNIQTPNIKGTFLIFWGKHIQNPGITEHLLHFGKGIYITLA